MVESLSIKSGNQKDLDGILKWEKQGPLFYLLLFFYNGPKEFSKWLCSILLETITSSIG
jgi:hypothetical protein